MSEPSFGDKVHVRPHAGLRVQEHAAIPGRFMPDEWVARVWDDWLHRRYSTGEILIKPAEDETPVPAPAEEATPAPAIPPAAPTPTSAPVPAGDDSKDEV